MTETFDSQHPKSGRMLVRLDPLDLLLFREAKPFDASSKVKSGLPNPQTIAGALRTAMLSFAGISFERLGEEIRSGSDFQTSVNKLLPDGNLGSDIGKLRFRGPWFGRERSGESDIFFKIPATLRKIKGKNEFVRLDPVNEIVPGWNPKIPGMKPLWTKYSEKLESGDFYISTNGMSKFLDGGLPSSTHSDQELIPASELYEFDNRTGISIDAKTSATKEGMIYSVSMLSVASDTCLIVEVVGSTGFLNEMLERDQIIQVGGEGRQARLSKLSSDSDFARKLSKFNNTIEHGESNSTQTSVDTSHLPNLIDNSNDLTGPNPVSIASHLNEGNSNLSDSFENSGSGSKRLIVLTTPALLDDWYPKNSFEPLTAAVTGFETHSGWDLARNGPKPNRFAVPAGTVYFLKPDEEFSPATSKNLGEDSELGWGCYIEGKWDYV